MSSEWVQTTVGEFCPFIYGKALPERARVPGAYAVVSSAGVTGSHNVPLTNCGGIVIGRKGTVGSVTLCQEPFWPIDTAYYVLDEPNKRNLHFTYYLLGSIGLSGMNSDSAVPGLNRDNAHAISIAVPSLPVQKQISGVLKALDDRVALLRKTNATLEAIAQALFKSWFVDFDPVYENQAANPATLANKALENKEQAPSLPPEIQALFPATFTDSPQGPIPEGWDLKVLYEVAEYVNGAAYKAFEPNLEKRGLPIIKIAELKAGVTDQTAYSDVLMKEKYKIDDRSILFSWSGNPDTSIDTFVWSHGPAWLNQHIFNVIPTAPSERSFVLMLLKHMKPIFTEIARDKQTTGLGHVTIADLKRLLVTIPEKQVLSHWNEIVDPIVERSFAVVQQMQNLVSLRDTLLPRLISGQLRLPEAEQAIAAITD